jgi:quercetin dioxygenase-like cupin family protein
MAIPHAGPGLPIDLRPAGESRTEARSIALAKTNEFEVIRLVLPQGHEVCHEHQVDGPVTIQCLEGRATLTVEGTTHDLAAGRWLYLPARVPHTLRGVENSLVLLTIIFSSAGRAT